MMTHGTFEHTITLEVNVLVDFTPHPSFFTISFYVKGDNLFSAAIKKNCEPETPFVCVCTVLKQDISYVVADTVGFSLSLMMVRFSVVNKQTKKTHCTLKVE